MGTAPTRTQFTAPTGGARREPALAPAAPSGGGEAAGPDEPALSRQSPGPLACLIGGAVFVIDPSLRCLVADGDAIRLAGLAPADVAGRPLADLLDPLLLADLEPQCRLALAGRPFAWAHETGGHPYQARGVPLPGESGAIDAALVAIYDIADRRQVEEVGGCTDAGRSEPGPHEVTAAAAARLGQALRASQIVYADVAADGLGATTHAVWSDGSVPATTGPPLEALGAGLIDELGAGRTVVLRDTWTDPRTSAPEVRAMFAHLDVRAGLYVPLLRSGRLAAVLVVRQTGPRDWQPTDIAFAIEVAERIRGAVEQAGADARLRDSQARLALVLEASGMGTFVWHLDQRRGEPDGRALELLGLSDLDVSLDDALDVLIPAEDRPRCAALLERALDPAGPGTLQADIRVRRPDGTERWLAVTARAAFAGEPLRAVRLAGVVADVDERKRAEASLRAREEALTRADRRKDEFLAVLAHELRNPLAPIRAGLELIRLSGVSTPALEQTRGIMERQVGHMVRLIDDLLDVSRISSGKIGLERQPSLLEGLVSIAVDANRTAIEAAQLRLDVALPEAPVWLDADPTRLVQVISNVLHNAVKFSDAGGHIAITGTIEEPRGGAGMLALAIADAGIGISPDVLPHIFELFTQDRSVQGRSQGGLGIGLALARRLVEMHGGSIEARSDGAGQGTIVTIRVPLGADPQPLSGTPAAPTPRTKHRVLVVDDNLDAAQAIGMLVTALGGEARVAGDGATGLDQVRTWAPTFVLLDLDMPGMDGFETCRRIRALMGTRVLIVALTGWGQEQHKREAERAGFDAHLVKPAEPALLGRLLAEPPHT